MKRKIKKICCFLVILILLLVLYNNYTLIKIYGDSMFPTYHAKSIHILKKGNKDINQFDVIVFKLNNNDTYIKRVIALPNDTITCKNNIIYVNGNAVDDEFAKFTNDFENIKLKKDESAK